MVDSAQIIESIRPQNFWTADPFVGFARRNYVDRLEHLVASRMVIAVTGVRRSGKTTIARQLLHRLIHERSVDPRRTLFVNLDSLRMPVPATPGEAARSAAGIDLLDGILTAHRAHIHPAGPTHIVLDEVHAVPGWERWARRLHDLRDVPGGSPAAPGGAGARLVVTGSSSNLLSRELGTVLTGRHLDLEVFPLSFSEYLVFHGIDPASTGAAGDGARALGVRYLASSAFPEIVRLAQADTADLQDDVAERIYRDILTRDILQRYNVKGLQRLESLARLLLHAVPGPVTANSLHRSLADRLSLQTVQRFLRYLQEPYLLFLVATHAFSARKREVLPRKVYAIDNGLLLAASHRFSADTGKLLENAVFLELRRRASSTWTEIYRVMGKREVDFLLWQGREAVGLVNACAEMDAGTTRARELEGLDEAMGLYGLEESVIVTISDSEEIPVPNGTVHAVPFHRWALESAPTSPARLRPRKSGKG